MTAPRALSAAIAAQRAYVDHISTCPTLYPCRKCRELELTASAAYARVDAELEASQR